MKTSNITSRQDGITKDIREPQTVMQSYNIPGLGITVEAMSMDEALIKAKALIKTSE